MHSVESQNVLPLDSSPCIVRWPTVNTGRPRVAKRCLVEESAGPAFAEIQTLYYRGCQSPRCVRQDGRNSLAQGDGGGVREIHQDAANGSGPNARRSAGPRTGMRASGSWRRHSTARLCISRNSNRRALPTGNATCSAT